MITDMKDAANERAWELIKQIEAKRGFNESLYNYALIIAAALREAYEARDALAAALRQLYFGSGLQADWEVAKAVLDQHAPGWRKANK